MSIHRLRLQGKKHFIECPLDERDGLVLVSESFPQYFSRSRIKQVLQMNPSQIEMYEVYSFSTGEKVPISQESLKKYYFEKVSPEVKE